MKTIITILLTLCLVAPAVAADYNFCVNIPDAQVAKAKIALLTLWKKPGCKALDIDGSCLTTWGDVEWLNYKHKKEVRQWYHKGNTIQYKIDNPVPSDQTVVIP